jgi:hypothetical protein
MRSFCCYSGVNRSTSSTYMYSILKIIHKTTHNNNNSFHWKITPAEVASAASAGFCGLSHSTPVDHVFDACPRANSRRHPRVLGYLKRTKADRTSRSDCSRGLRPDWCADSRSPRHGGTKELYTQAPFTSLEVINMGKGRPPICFHCNSARSIRKGRRRTKQLGVRQIRLCKGCGRKFTPRHQKTRSDDG